jgi:hypothetical protein
LEWFLEVESFESPSGRLKIGRICKDPQRTVTRDADAGVLAETTSSCAKTTVTDYWVSCSSDSCTTTSSAVETGCSLTATTTTIGSYCPATVSVDPIDDDQGDGDTTFQDIGMIVTATYPESIQIGQTPLPVIGGFVDISGIAYSVVDVTAPLETSLGSQDVTIFPAFIGSSYSITATYLTIETVSEPLVTTTWGVIPTPPEATCSIQGNLDNEGVAVWTNYVTDGGAALLAALTSSCGDLGLSDWSVAGSSNTYTDSNGVNWEADNDFRFTLGLARAAAELECVNAGIPNAGGDPNNPTCDFTPALG